MISNVCCSAGSNTVEEIIQIRYVVSNYGNDLQGTTSDTPQNSDHKQRNLLGKCKFLSPWPLSYYSVAAIVSAVLFASSSVKEHFDTIDRGHRTMH